MTARHVVATLYPDHEANLPLPDQVTNM
jgi:hypothetical protein